MNQPSDTTGIKYSAVRLPLYTLLVIFLLLLSTSVAAAHGEGGVIQLADRPIGPHYLTVWTAPGIPRVGEVHIEALVTNADGVPVSDCDITVRVTPLGGSEDAITTSAVVSGPSGGMRHEADFSLNQPGDYRVDIEVVAAAAALGQQTFDMTVTGVSAWVKGAINALLLATGLLGLWLLWQGMSILQRQLLITH